MAVLNLTEKDFARVVGKENSSVVLEFYADWCKPCHKMLPVVEKLSEEYNSIDFYKIDSDEEAFLAAALKASTLPTLVFVKDGVVKYATEGNVSEAEILKGIEKIK
ncbi:MAG: thioredoxin family protein [Ruminococcaceae bacterium]|nr:thioredoxin family protein [Oscillospiraceae bacterium]